MLCTQTETGVPT